MASGRRADPLNVREGWKAELHSQFESGLHSGMIRATKPLRSKIPRAPAALVRMPLMGANKGHDVVSQRSAPAKATGERDKDVGVAGGLELAEHDLRPKV